MKCNLEFVGLWVLEPCNVCG